MGCSAGGKRLGGRGVLIFNVSPCSVDENKGIEVGEGGEGLIIVGGVGVGT